MFLFLAHALKELFFLKRVLVGKYGVYVFKFDYCSQIAFQYLLFWAQITQVEVIEDLEP